jgi:ATP/ADP translocase
MATLLFLLIAANNLIKILRDSIFLGQHSVSELPYLYILVAVFAGVIIATYTRYTAHLSLVRLILATNALIILMSVFFWFLLTYVDPGWSHYAFYIWSAMVSVIAVAQLWTLVNQIFKPEEGKRLFGLLATGGTLGGATAGFGAKWAIHLSVESNHLLWVVGGIYLTASLLLCITQRRLRKTSPEKAVVSPIEVEPGAAENVFARLADSRYLKTIAAVILVSVIVSTLFDFQLKTAAKETYPSRSALAAFFSSYYAWLSVATFFAQVILTGRALTKLGLNSGLYVTPAALLTGSLAIMIWPGLLAAALTRIADSTLRNSIHRSSMEIVYMGVPANVKKAIKTFLDVVVERIGDAGAGFIILLFSLSSAAGYKTYVHFICVGLIFVWMVLIQFLRSGYSEAIRNGLVPDDVSPEADWLATDRIKRSLGD